MSKFDVVDRLPAADLLGGRKDAKLPHELLREAGILGGGRFASYTSYGRAALEHLFSDRFRGKKIAFPAFVCPQVVRAAVRGGAVPALVDADIGSFNMDIGLIPDDCEAVFAVHTFGNPMDLRGLKGKTVIEDCAHALFSQIGGKYAGGFGDYVLFSLYKQVPNVNGALLMSKDGLSLQGLREEHLPLMRLLSSSREFGLFSDILRSNRPLPESRTSDAAAEAPNRRVFSLFWNGFRKLKAEVEARNRLAEHYRRRAAESGLVAQKVALEGRGSYFNFSVRLADGGGRERDLLLTKLRRKKIFCDRVWYDIPQKDPSLIKYAGNCPNALRLSESVINLPIRSTYKGEDVDFLFDKVTELLTKK